MNKRVDSIRGIQINRELHCLGLTADSILYTTCSVSVPPLSSKLLIAVSLVIVLIPSLAQPGVASLGILRLRLLLGKQRRWPRLRLLKCETEADEDLAINLASSTVRPHFSPTVLIRSILILLVAEIPRLNTC